jgi:hypothetical protein
LFRDGARNLSNLTGVPILVIWLYGTLVLAKAIGVRDHPPQVDPRVVVPVIHMKGAGVGGAIAKSSGAFFFIWILLALGAGAAGPAKNEGSAGGAGGKTEGEAGQDTFRGTSTLRLSLE